MKDKISVIIPTYNRAKIIKKSIDSVLNQTYSNIELIIVDDGSSDNTEDVIKSIKDERLFYYKLEKNSGTAVARNYGIEKSTCDYIAFQDSDDIFREDKLEKQMKNMKINKSVMDFCKICIHEGENEILIPTADDDKTIKEKGIVNKLCENNVISTQAILIKKSIVEEYKFDHDIPNTDDYDLALRVAIDHKVSYTNIPLVDLYRQKDSITYSIEKLRKSCISMLKKDYKLTEEQYKTFHGNLLFQANKNKYEEYWNKILKNREDIEKLNNRIKELEEENKKSNKEKKDIIKDKDKILNDYNAIVNSRRWKIISKIMKIFGK